VGGRFCGPSGGQASYTQRHRNANATARTRRGRTARYFKPDPALGLCRLSHDRCGKSNGAGSHPRVSAVRSVGDTQGSRTPTRLETRGVARRAMSMTRAHSEVRWRPRHHSIEDLAANDATRQPKMKNLGRAVATIVHMTVVNDCQLRAVRIPDDTNERESQ
jgi:hypothetical protein